LRGMTLNADLANWQHRGEGCDGREDTDGQCLAPTYFQACDDEISLDPIENLELEIKEIRLPRWRRFTKKYASEDRQAGVVHQNGRPKTCPDLIRQHTQSLSIEDEIERESAFCETQPSTRIQTRRQGTVMNHKSGQTIASRTNILKRSMKKNSG